MHVSKKYVPIMSTEYKAIQPVYRLTFYKDDGTFDIVNWLA